jgi:hypothetical protein
MTTDKPRGNLRFSLGTLLLLTAIVALGVTLWQAHRELASLRPEVRRLRQELGHLSIDDETKIYAIEIPTMAPNTWKWRVYLPPGRAFEMNTQLKRIPGRPKGLNRREWLNTLSGPSNTIASGEFTIEAKMEKGEVAGSWFLHTMDLNNNGASGAGMDWLDDRRAWYTSSDVSPRQQVELSTDDGLILLAIRKGNVVDLPTGWKSTPPPVTAEAPGVMLWIGPIK